MTTYARLVAAFAAIALLGGCSSSPATRYYTLAATATPAPAKAEAGSIAAAKSVTLVVGDVRLPQYLDRPQIMSRGSDHRLRMSEFEQWGGNLRDDTMRVLAENLGRLLPGSRVLAAPYHQALQPDYRIEADILRFERETDGRVRLAAHWWIIRVADASILADANESFTGELVGEGSGDALVEAMSAVYGELARAIARDIGKHEAGRQ